MKFGPFENGPLIIAFEDQCSILLLNTANLSPLLSLDIVDYIKPIFSNIPGSGFMMLDSTTHVLRVIKLVEERYESHYVQVEDGRTCIVEIPI